jgi:hypothetical protein
MEYRIDTELRSLLPPQTDDERRRLTEKIETEGCSPGSVVVAKIGGERILIDGHNTVEICRDKGLPLCEPREIAFADKDAAKAWIVNNQLARRNLSDKQRSYFLGMKFNTSKKTQGGNRKQDVSNRHCDGLTAGKVAAEHGVSVRTVERAGAFAEAVDTIAESEGDDAKAAILNGTSGHTKKETIDKARRIALATAGRSEDDPKTPPANSKGKPKKDAKKKSAEMHAAIGQVIRYADDLAGSKPKFANLRDSIHKSLQDVKNNLIALERAAG